MSAVLFTAAAARPASGASGERADEVPAALKAALARSLARDGGVGTWVQRAKLTAADGAAGAELGFSVALEGDIALVGARLADVDGNADQGAAYIFTRSGETWNQQAKLTANDGAAEDQFGFSVALDGDTALVGALDADEFFQGAAYVFTRSGDTWSQQAKLDAVDVQTVDFGISVALAGDTALVGDRGTIIDGKFTQGTAYVFTRSGVVWNQQAKLTAADGETDDFFGGSVALQGDTALVGAAFAHIDGNADQGAAYVFVRSGDLWNQQAKLTAADGAAGEVFGISTALGGDTALVGARWAEVNGNTFQGAAYVFTRSGGVWSQQEKLTATDGAAFDEFGVSVALAGDTALVGGTSADVDGNLDQGAAYFFTRSGAEWSQQAKLTADDGTAGNFFGSFVALTGDTAVVGAQGVDVDGSEDQGAAYVFTLEEPELSFDPASLDFGDVELGTSETLLATLENSGDGDATGLDSTLSGVGFAADTSACGESLPAGGSCSVSVTFTPAETGPFAGLLTVGSGEGAAADLGLAGNGVGQPVLAFNPPGLDFGDIELGTSETLIATLENSGNDDATGLNFTLSGTGFAADTSACGESLPVGGSCPVTVTFTPAETGPAAGVLTAASDEGATADLGLAGNGVGEPVLVFDPPDLDFGDVELGSSEARTATLANTGNDGATELAFTLSGEGFEADTSACGVSLPVGASCAVSVTFTPTEAGPATGILNVASNEGAAADLGLAGTGLSKTEVFSPTALLVDPEAGDLSDGNQIFEPGERVEVTPAWRNDGEFPQLLTGTAADFTGPDGPVYTLVLDAADYGEVEPGGTASCVDAEMCYQMDVGPPGVPRPSTHWDATFEETLSDETVKPWTLHIGDSFTDVPRASLFYRPVETLLHHGVSGDPSLARLQLPLLGCSETEFCPAAAVTRAGATVFLLKGFEGGAFDPPDCESGSERFDDVPAEDPFCPWIEELARRGVTAGCGGDDYCPDAAMTRAQMAVFLLKTAEGPNYVPPECSGVFDDVPCPSLFADWIEDLFVRGITTGCGGGNYCPNQPTTRAQMAAFIARTFGLVLYGP